MIDQIESMAARLQPSNGQVFQDAQAGTWLVIGDYPDYEVSDRGEIRRRITYRNYPAGMPIKPKINCYGYLTVRLSHRGVARDLFVHRLVATAILGPAPTPRHQVAHNDGHQRNNCVENLRWATPSENALDRRRHGTVPDRKGEKHPYAKLTENIVRQMRAARAHGRTFKAISESFGVPMLTVHNAVVGKTWSHI